MLFLADDLGHAPFAVVGEGLLGPFQPAVGGRGLARRHGRRQIGQPLGRKGEAAHHLQRRRRVLLGHDDPTAQGGVDPAATADIFHVQEIISLGLGGASVCSGRQGTHGLAPDLVGGRLDQLSFRPAKGGQLAAKDAAGVDAEGVVDPLRLEHGGVAVDHGRFAAIVGGPVGADRQAERVDFTGGLAVEGELAHRAGATADHLGLETGMRDRQATAVEPEMAAQIVDERPDGFLEAAIGQLVLVDGLLQAVGDGHLAA